MLLFFQPIIVNEVSPETYSILMNSSQLIGKSTEMLVASMLLDEGRELYLPAVDDHGVDMIVRTKEKNTGGRLTC